MTREEIQLKAISGPNAFLYRTALEQDHINGNVEVRSSGMWFVATFSDPHVQMFAWLTESLATALEHPDRDIATRAAFQAKGYLERLASHSAYCGGPRYYDAVREAIERVVGWVRITMQGN